MTDNTRLIVKCVLIAILTAIVLLRYARMLRCSWCRDPYGIFQTNAGDLCWSCAGVYDRAHQKAQRKRSLLRRIWRSAA